ncbi:MULTISPECIES: PKD domain-containing protein [Streptosporangium]|uniref:Repeat protein (TIGR01451 family) n=1 Tax=Streptosporangium brasiliense TaxID=47480 RepID=A0ABT9RF94_9ACTN|nr:PKD domain-containing protein [Streptosporangium brasiliense]MDP9867943.1 putative repeat protein (TIGR01451 family) [Streptosporangium brasiliense]
MHRLFNRASARRIAHPLIAVVLGSLATPLPVLAASQDATTASTARPIELMHLADMNTSDGKLGKINNKGQIVGQVPNPDSPLGRYPKTVLFSREADPFTDLHAIIGGDYLVSSPRDINNEGAVIVGTSDTSASFLVKNGTATRLPWDPAGTAINDRGQIAGSMGVWSPDGSILKLQAFKHQYMEPSAMTNGGTVVGFADIDSGPLIDWRAFRTRPGEPLNLSRDLLIFGNAETRAMDVNDHDEVAGYVDRAGPDIEDIPVIWDEEGEAQEQDVPHGGRVYAINNDGVGVGVMFDAHAAPRAAMYVNGVATDLTNLVRAAGKDVYLKYASGINDLGQIAVVGRYGTSVADHVFLLDLGVDAPRLESFTLETQRYPSTDWRPVPDIGGSTVEGNKVRISMTVRNHSTTHPVRGYIRLADNKSKKPIVTGEIQVDLAPGQTKTIREIWDTTGWAWDNKSDPLSDRGPGAILYVAGNPVDGLANRISIVPKPVVAVHGFRSDAQDTWGEFDEIMKELGHPDGNVFAVGDGQAEGRMDTGEKWNPLHESYTMAQNVDELATYIEDVRKKTGAFHINLVAHSMGTLISRQYIQERMPSTPDNKPAVTRLIAMGAPNAGSPCADMVVERSITEELSPWFPAVIENTTEWVNGDGEHKGFNGRITNLKGVRASNLVGDSWLVPCTTANYPLPFMGDGVVPWWSALHLLPGWGDHPITSTLHSYMTFSDDDFVRYVRPRLVSLVVGAPPVTGLTDKQAVQDEKTAAVTGGSLSMFGAPTVSVEPGKTASVPLQVPRGSAFGVTGVLPETVGLSLRDPSGKVAASYAAGSDAAKQQYQGLSVADPQEGAWTLEVTSTAAQAVRADLTAWVTGNPVQVVAKAAAAEDGRVMVTAKVTDDGQPVTGAPVRAWLAGVEHRQTLLAVTLKDDGASDDGAAGDGVYGARTDVLADDQYYVVAKAETAKGVRTDRDVVEVAKPDLREFALTLSAGPGGSVAAAPAREAYRAGTTVKVTATPDAGRVPIGWVVDGQKRGPGPLTVTMDGPHTVKALFGTFKVTELGTLPGGDVSKTYAERLNDRGQVAATAMGKDGKRHAVRWQDGALTELTGLTCADGAVKCETGAFDINRAGEVSGWSVGSANGSNAQHAVVWRADGSVTDLRRGDGTKWPAATGLNDNGQVVGDAGRLEYTIWDRGAADALPAEFVPGVSYDNDWHQNQPLRINDSGAIAGGHALGKDANGLPTDTGPAIYANGMLTKLPGGPVAGCAQTAGRASDVNAHGLVVGTLRCGRYEQQTPKRAYAWQGGEPADLGEGDATAVNDDGLIVGFEQGPNLSRHKRPVMWVDGTKYPLTGVLSRPWCPEDAAKTTQPCVGAWKVQDVNSSGQILVWGYVRDRAADGDGFVQRDRSYLLTPAEALADLQVTAEVSAAEPGPGSKVTWTATVTNKGDDPATDVRLDVLIPRTVTGAACDTWRGVCAPIKDGFRNTVKVLEPGWSATVEVTAAVPAGTPDGTGLKAGVHGYSTEVADPKTGDNAAEVTATVRPLLDRPALNWPDPVKVGEVSPPYAVKLTNRLNEPIPLKVIAVTGPFTQANACPVELAVGAVCTVEVRFAPTQEGPATGALTFTTADGGQPAYTVPLTGQGAKPSSSPMVQAPAAPVRGEVGKPFTLEVAFTDADAADSHTARVAWGDGPPVDAQVIAGPGGGTVKATRTFTAPRTGTALVIVTDGAGNTGSAGVPYVIGEAAQNTAPVLDAGHDAQVRVGQKLQRHVFFTDPDSTSWTATVDYGDGAGPRPVTPDADLRIWLDQPGWAAPGAYPVTVKVTDDGGLAATAAFQVTVVPADHAAPTVTLRSPANVVEAGAEWVGMGSFSDPGSTSWTYTADYGDGAGPQPLALTAGQLKLQHTFGAAGDHTVVLTVTDEGGASGSARFTVHVTDAAPQVTLKAPAVAKVVRVGEAVPFGASFSGAGDIRTAVWTIGGRPVAGAVSGHRGKGTVTGSHVFTKAGRYPISVTVTGDRGVAATASTVAGEQAYVLVYDPDSALVGAGQAVAPAGACKLDAGCAGQKGEATLDVTARYRGKAATPTGGLRYTAPGFDLRAASAAVLAVNGDTAILRGAGKVNKTVDVVFEITTVDSGTHDKLTVKVWKKNGELVYDTGVEPAQVSGTIRVSG